MLSRVVIHDNLVRVISQVIFTRNSAGEMQSFSDYYLITKDGGINGYLTLMVMVPELKSASGVEVWCDVGSLLPPYVVCGSSDQYLLCNTRVGLLSMAVFVSGINVPRFFWLVLFAQPLLLRQWVCTCPSRREVTTQAASAATPPSSPASTPCHWCTSCCRKRRHIPSHRCRPTSTASWERYACEGNGGSRCRLYSKYTHSIHCKLRPSRFIGVQTLHTVARARFTRPWTRTWNFGIL